uniref:Putative ovule protein n=1 Tax=Solanum chacoense TaxID=4108 RepID=A0A0V0H623_SOLCH
MLPVAFDFCHDISLCHGCITYSSHLALSSQPLCYWRYNTQLLPFPHLCIVPEHTSLLRTGKTTCITLL